MRGFLNRPLVMMAVGALLLLYSIGWFAGGGIGIIIGLLLAVFGGYDVWRGFTKWREGT